MKRKKQGPENREPDETEKKKQPGPLGVRWSVAERADINQTAIDKGVGPTQVIRLAVKEYIDAHRKDRPKPIDNETKS